MARRKLSTTERWQVVGMANTGLSCRRITVHFGVNHTVIIRLVHRYRQTGSVEDRPRAGRPRKTTAREDRNLSRQARLKLFSSDDQLRRLWPIGGRIEVAFGKESTKKKRTSIGDGFSSFIRKGTRLLRKKPPEKQKEHNTDLDKNQEAESISEPSELYAIFDKHGN
ncbi:uncharacterized protein LOC134717876 [Mytilus trossulus]|uniref:uncharacterized protein LOC134717876 n=1 Tax=Mytilus trossulus TaxID=6551 RepID=UPI0030065CCE